MILPEGMEPQSQLESDFLWPPETFDINDQNMDVTMMLNDWMGTSRPVGDLFNLDMNQDWTKL